MTYLPVDKVGIVDAAGKRQSVTVFGDSIVTEKFVHIAAQFFYNINSRAFLSYSVNGGGVISSASMATISSSVATNGSASLFSRDYVRYSPGQECFSFFTSQFTAGSASSHQQVGLFDDEDGMFIWMSGTTSSSSFGVCRRKGSVDSFISQSEFNLDKLDGTGNSRFNLNPENINVFKVSFGYLGGAPMLYEVMNESGSIIPFHRLYHGNVSKFTNLSNPILPMQAKVFKTAGTTDIVLRTASWSGGTYQHVAPAEVKVFFNSNNSKLSITTETALLTLFNSGSFVGKQNKIVVYLTSFNFGVQNGGNKTAKIRFVHNATLGGTPVFNQIDANNSVMFVDNASVFDIFVILC